MGFYDALLEPEVVTAVDDRHDAEDSFDQIGAVLDRLWNGPSRTSIDCERVPPPWRGPNARETARHVMPR